MTEILGLKASPDQTFNIADPNGGGMISCELYFRPRVSAWFLDLSFSTFKMNGFKLTFGPNVLDQYSNIIPFGLAVISSDKMDPFLINDFTSGRIALYLLTTSEVETIEADIKSGSLTG